jgi:hypothetical protein
MAQADPVPARIRMTYFGRVRKDNLAATNHFKSPSKRRPKDFLPIVLDDGTVSNDESLRSLTIASLSAVLSGCTFSTTQRRSRWSASG